MALTPQQAFEAEQLQRLRDRAATILTTDQAVVRQLLDARDAIVQLLAGQPADWQQWQLSKILEQINAVLDGATGRAAAAIDNGLRTAWIQGEAVVDAPLAAGGVNVALQMPLLNVDVLTSLRQFATLRLKDVGVEAARKIGLQLSLVLVGAETPNEAMRKVQDVLGDHSRKRAETIVRTEVARAFAMSSQQRMEQAAKLVPGLRKKWRRSGKIHSRWNHDAIDGQIQPVDQPFKVPTNDGVIEMMYPHDPTAPASEVINCGCIALQALEGWDSAIPGAKPFTAEEVRLDGRKAALQQAADRLGLRQS
jgi:hypothetical protein